MIRRGVSAAAAGFLALAGCAAALRPPRPGGLPPGADASSLAARVHALAREIEGERASGRRRALAEEAVAAGQGCEALAPDTARCDYALAIALGLQAREHPATVREGLARMATLLRRAAAAEPGLDHAGPERVLALLLLQAPGWPLGPGDVEEGLAVARRAVERAPDYAPNQLALGEGLARNGDRAGGRAAAERALQLAEQAERSGEPDAAGWRRQALALLAR